MSLVEREFNPELNDPVLVVGLEGWIDSGMGAANAMSAVMAGAGAEVVATFDAEISVRRGETVVSGESIMGLMMLAAGPGTTVELRATGRDAAAAMDALLDLINRKFDEE